MAWEELRRLSLVDSFAHSHRGRHQSLLNDPARPLRTSRCKCLCPCAGSALPAGPLAPVTTIGYHDVSPTSDPNFTNSGGYDWVVAKYGQDAEVFYIGDITGDVTLSNLTGNQNGLSGYTRYNPGTTTVPDGGATVALIGAGLTGLGLIRRKLS